MATRVMQLHMAHSIVQQLVSTFKRDVLWLSSSKREVAGEWHSIAAHAHGLCIAMTNGNRCYWHCCNAVADAVMSLAYGIDFDA